MVYAYIISIALNSRHAPRIKVARTNYLASNLNIFINKTPVPSSGILFTYLFINKRLYYNSGLSLNKSIGLTSTSL